MVIRKIEEFIGKIIDKIAKKKVSEYFNVIDEDISIHYNNINELMERTDSLVLEMEQLKEEIKLLKNENEDSQDKDTKFVEKIPSTVIKEWFGE